MHELAIAQSLLEIAEEEAKKAGCDKLKALTVQFGPLSGIMPEALALCFEMLTKNTPHENAILSFDKIPLKLRCPFCKEEFGGYDTEALWQPCPACGESFGHIVLQGKELLLSHLEAETAVQP